MAWHERWAGGGLPWILVIGKAALAADLIMGVIFKHLEQSGKANYPKSKFSANLAALAAKLLMPTLNKIELAESRPLRRDSSLYFECLDTRKTHPDTQKTNPDIKLTIPGTQLTNPGTRPQQI